MPPKKTNSPPLSGAGFVQAEAANRWLLQVAKCTDHDTVWPHQGGTRPTPSQVNFTLSPWDRVQAIKHHPEFQRLLTLWREIRRKEEAGIERTDAERALGLAPRSLFNVEAEMETSRYGVLSLAEREYATMTGTMTEDEREWAWRECSPQLDWVRKTAVVCIPLDWTMAAIEKIVGRIVRIYRERIGLADTKHKGPTLDDTACAPQLLSDTLTLRIPLVYPVEIIDETVRRIVRKHKKDLGLTSSQRVRRPEVDPWLVYRLHHDDKLSPLDITHQLFGTSGSPAYAEELNMLYSRVKRAYQFAKDAIDFIGQEYATKDS